MFIMKFIREFNVSEASVVDVLTCNHYEIYARPNGVKTITTYPDHTRIGGVERHVTTTASTGWDEDPVPDGCFDLCYVENQNGKTVDVIRSDKVCAK